MKTIRTWLKRAAMLSVTVAFAAAGFGANAATSLTLNDGDTLTGVYEDCEITIAAGATVTFNNATVMHTSGDGRAAIDCAGNATIVLAEGTENFVSNTVDNCAAIHPAANATLTIRGSGSLDAYSSGDYGAGIGATSARSNANPYPCGNIVIEGGTITAHGGSCGAGVGAAAWSSPCGDITITGNAVVTASSGQYAAAIGASSDSSPCGNITISGNASVTAKKDAYQNAAGIGACHSSPCGNIVIDTTGTVDAEGSYSAAIGASYESTGTCGDITIRNGTIFADGGDRCSGIGATFAADSGSILISGGTITAEGETDGAGIGARGATSSITISAGVIDATGGTSGAGIGSCNNSTCGDITITEGITRVIAVKGMSANASIGAGGGSASAGTVTISPQLEQQGSLDGILAILTQESIEQITPVLTTGGAADWYVEDEEGIEPGAWRSGEIGDSTNTWLKIAVSKPCKVYFCRKVSSESGYDCLRLYLNGAELNKISGTQDWAIYSATIESSLDDLRLSYGKDGSTARGSDCGWVKDISVVPFNGIVRTVTVDSNCQDVDTYNAYVVDGYTFETMPPIARYGYAFLGLFTAAEGGEQVTAPCTVTANTTLYAHWVKTLDFEATGSKHNDADALDPSDDVGWQVEDDGITWHSGAIGDSTNSWARFTLKRPGTLSFKWKVSSEINSDYLRFYVDGVETNRISGNVDWADVSWTSDDARDHVIELRYSKDGSKTSGQDCGWVKDVVFTPFEDVLAINLDLNYDGAEAVEPRYVKRGNAFDVDEIPDIPRPGYALLGWFTDAVGGEQVTAIGAVSADTTLHARWVKTGDFEYTLDNTNHKGSRKWTLFEKPQDGFEAGTWRTGPIGDNQETWIETSVDGPCTVFFKWKVSSEGGFDFLRFYVGEEKKAETSGDKTNQWEMVSCEIAESGSHVVKWLYHKDSGTVRGLDCGWVKDFVVTQGGNPYTVTWMNGSVAVETDENVEPGDTPSYDSAQPTQAATAQYYYDFAGWEPDLELASSNTAYTAVYTATLRSYDVTWQDEDGTELATETLYYGTTPEYAGETPTKPATPKYTYTFAGWDPEVAEVTGEATYTATYDATINKYTITWKNDDGTVIDSADVAYDETPTHADPTKASTAQYHYEFAGWDPAVASVTGEATYQATFTPVLRSYTITWLNENGSQIDTTTVAYGATPTHAAPTKASTAQYDYTFAGWGNDVAVSGEATYQATFTPVLRSYTITWANIDGAGAVATSTVAYGSIPAYGGVTPTKAETAEYTYTFSGWSPAVVSVTGAATYTAQFNATKRSYTITWANIDGAGTVATTTAEYGTTPSYGGATPTKAETAEYTYTFSGWSPAVVSVTGAATYTATFNATKRSYTITWANIDGEGAVATSTAEYGTTPSYGGETPTKAETAEHTYTFAGWSPAVVSVTGAATYTATFNATPKSSGETVDVSTLANGAVVQNGSVLTGTAPNLNLKVAAGATITLDGVSITNSASNVSTLHCLGDATIILAPGSENTIVGTVGRYCTGNAIYAPTNSTLTIKGSGSLYADSSASEFRSAAIGAFAQQYDANNVFPCGDIVIEGGTITARGGVGIGASGNGGYCGNITITGDANVTATATVNGSAGIGAAGSDGNCGNITISGNANVTATGKYNGPGIGAADHSTCGDIVISTTGRVEATGNYFAPGIGACGGYETCRCGDITISGGTVIATGSDHSPGIGTDYYYKRSGACGAITIADTITSVTAQGQDDSPGIYRPEESEPYCTYGSNLELVKSDSNRLYTLTPVAAPETFTVTWQNYDGTTLETDEGVAYGTVPAYSGTTPTKPADAQYTYTFAGWMPEVAAVTGDATYTAQFSETKRSYTVAWIVEGATVQSGAVEYGQTPTYSGATPTKESTAEYEYTFTGWSPAVSAVTGEATYTAQFEATKRSYTVAWVVEGATVQSDAVEYGQTPAYTGATPTKESTAEYSYTFTGWNPTVAAVTDDATYTAQFSQTKRSYTITWANIDGEDAVATSTVQYGQTPRYTGATPTKESTAEYSYTFSGWSPTVAAVTGAATYTAQFEATKRSYTITWANIDGEDAVATSTVQYGQTPRYTGATPTKESTAEYSYEFTGWSPVVAAVTDDATYTAQFEATKRSYTITWANIDGEGASTTSTVEYGTVPVYGSATPTKESTAEYSYAFTGWSPTVSTVTGEATYTAQFSSTKRSYPVTWIAGDSTMSEMVEYGIVPVYSGDEPTKAADEQYIYAFSGWNPAVVEVTGEATYTAQFSSTVRTYTITWVDGDGNTIGTSQVEYGQMPEYVGETPTKTATAQYTYAFSGWTPEVAAVSGDATYTATFTSETRTYTIVWQNYDNTKLAEMKLPYGTTPVYGGSTPTKPEDENYTYTFNGWTPAVVAVIGNATYTATFAATPKETEEPTELPDYVTTGGDAEWFVDTDGSWRSGTIMNSQETWIETTVTGPCLVTFLWKASSEGGGYDMLALAVDGEEKDSIGGVMSDWVEYSLPIPEAGSHTIRWTYYKDSSALEGEDCGWVKDFTVTPKEFAAYTVTWKNWDGTVLAEDSVVEGYMPVYRGETPARATDEEYYYTFSGWTPVVASVTGDAIYTATFDAHQARFEMVMDGTTVTGYIGLVPKHITLADWPEGVTAVADDSLTYLTELESIEIPATVETIGTRAFYNTGYSHLTNITFQAGGTAPLTIGFAAFYGAAIESITFPSRLAAIGSSAFYLCQNLASVTYLGDSNSVEIAQDAFKGTPYYSMLPFKMILMEIDGQQKVVSYQGTLPEVISLADWPAEATAIAGGSLGWNSIVKDITIPSTITSVDAQAFYSSYELTNVVFAVAAPGVEPAPLAIEESAFGECGKLRSVTLRDGLARIAGYAFSGCPLLAEVNFPPSGTDGAYIADSAFAGTEYESHLPFKFYVDESNIVTGFRGECPANIGGEGGVPWPDNISGIGSDAFSGCTTLEHVTFPAGIEAVALGAFRDCANLASVNFANCFATLTAIGGESFSGCTSLETVELDGDGLYIDSSAFESCTSLTTLTLGSGVSKVDEFAFAYSTSLAAFVNNSSAVIDETAFLGTAYNKNQPFSFITKRQWGELVLAGYRGECPAQITADMWPAGVTYVNRKSFTFCDTLRAVEFPANIDYIDESAFACCTNLASITFPEEGSLHVGHNAFALCTKLQNVTLKSGMEVENDAFGGCASLETVIVEEGVRTIGPGAFARTLVRSIVLPEGIHWVDNMSFAGNDGDFTLYIPRNADDGNYGVSDGTVEYEYYPLIFGLETEEGWARYGFVKRATTTDLHVIPYCRVTLDLAGGTGVATSQLGTGETVNDQFPHPVKAGFAFAGWTSARVAEIANDTTWTAIIGSATGMEATLTALWTPNETPEPPEIVVEDQELQDKLDDPVVDEDTGIRTIKPKDDQTTLTQEDADKIEIVSPLDGVTRITGAYVRTCSWEINAIVISLATPEVEPVVVEENKDEEDATGLLEDVAKVDDEKIAAMPEPDVSDPDPEKREEVGALPVKMYPGLYYQASWGDNLNNLTPGVKFRADGVQTHIGVIKQTGSKGFYKISVSER